MTMITFVPASAATLNVQVGDSPRRETSELYWLARVEPEHRVQLDDGGALDGIECGLGVQVGEPLDGKAFRDTWDYAHGYIRWFGGDKPCLIVLHVSAATFAPLRELAERGILPAAHLTFKDDRGITWGASPDADEVLWQNSKFKLVPVHEAKFSYDFAAKPRSP